MGKYRPYEILNTFGSANNTKPQRIAPTGR